jgi:hypothetical protein
MSRLEIPITGKALWSTGPADSHPGGTLLQCPD